MCEILDREMFSMATNDIQLSRINDSMTRFDPRGSKVVIVRSIEKFFFSSWNEVSLYPFPSARYKEFPSSWNKISNKNCFQNIPCPFTNRIIQYHWKTNSNTV